MVAGAEGYRSFTELFIETCQNLSFNEVCKDFIPFLPETPANILDAGSGAGQNSAALAEMGFSVTAIEPIHEFRCAAQSTYEGISVKWLAGNLPQLACLEENIEEFDFVLIEGVWHHLDEVERVQAAARISKIVKLNGKCAISLRNGPPGLGSCVYPTDTELTSELFENYGFECIFKKQNLDSILPNKENVKWSRIVLQKS